MAAGGRRFSRVRFVIVRTEQDGGGITGPLKKIKIKILYLAL